MRAQILFLSLVVSVGATVTSAQTAQPATAQGIQVTQQVDLSNTIQKYAAEKGISVAQARLDTCLFLGLASNVAGIHQGNVTFQKISTDVLRITADEEYFARLPAMMKSLELGKKQVVVHIHTLMIAPDESEEVHRLLTRDSVKVHYDRIPMATPIATAADDIADGFESFVATSTVIHQNVPVTIGELSQQNFGALKQYIKTSPTASIQSSPNVAALPTLSR